MCNGWADLCNYRNDGHYTIDNMVAERAIRPFTVKRKGSMFFSSEKGVKMNRGNKDYASLTPSKVVLK